MHRMVEGQLVWPGAKLGKGIEALCLEAQLCPTLCDPVDYSPPGSSVHEDSPGKNTGVGCQALLQGIFPTQSSLPNSGFPHCKRILYLLSHQGSPNTHTVSPL